MILKNPRILIVSITVAAVILIREFGFVDFNYYNSACTSHSTNHWSDKSVKLEIDNNILKHPDTGRFSDFPIVVVYKNDTLYQENGNRPPIVVTINRFSSGFLWAPLYKSSSFSAEGETFFSSDVLKLNGKKLIAYQPNIEGEFSISGNIVIKGICSHRNASNIVKDAVVKDFVTQVKTYFSTLD